MRTIQEIFDAVIDFGHYAEQGLMCWALQDAGSHGLISEDEEEFATAEIENYLSGYITLSQAIKCEGLTMEPITILKDWENRPTLKH